MDTLCWKCNNYHCSWMQWLKPVNGWQATPHKEVGGVKEYRGNKKPKSYTVKNCPEFK